MLAKEQSMYLDLKPNPEDAKLDRFSKNPNKIKITVYYQKKGINYFTYAQNQEGIHVGMTPVTVRKDDGPFTVESFMMGSGLKGLLEPAARLNRKRIATVFLQVKKDLEAKTGTAYDVLQALLRRNPGLELAEPAAQEAPVQS